MTKENLKKVEERWWAGINSTGFEMAEVFQLAERALEYESENNLPRQLFFNFRDMLDRWMFDNSESVCGSNMIDIDYLDGHIFELFCELNIVRFDADGNRID